MSLVGSASFPGNDKPSWYLDPLVAVQKRQVHQEWIRMAGGCRTYGNVLKTDLFEDAYGDDRVFHDLFPGTGLRIGIDANAETVRRAVRLGAGAFEGFVCDVRHLALPDASIDLVVSTSTLDHFKGKRDIADSFDELNRVTRPGATVIVTLDNPRNPFYFILRWFIRHILSRGVWATFHLGATLSMTELEEMLVERGFHVDKKGYLIHNPRGLSTLLFLGSRRLLGRHADAPIRMFLRCFMLLGRLPTRSFTGCFLAVSAVKHLRIEEPQVIGCRLPARPTP
jgi:SAM-dependent methyltransferase